MRPIDASFPTDVPLDFVADNWRRFVMPQGQPNRRAYELCMLSTLRDKLRSGDIYLPNSRRYTDPETFLIPRSTWPQLRTDVCQELDLDPTGQTRLSERAQQLKDMLPRVDRMLDRSDGIRIEDGELIVPMDDAEDLPESVQALETRFAVVSPTLICPTSSWKSTNGRALVSISRMLVAGSPAPMTSYYTCMRPPWHRAPTWDWLRWLTALVCHTAAWPGLAHGI
jgi:hypothetical protein